MLKLYKRVDGILHYWETWEKDQKTGVVHWGIVGEKGKKEEIRSSFLASFHKSIQRSVDQRLDEGYEEMDDLPTLRIEYKIDGMGTMEELDKRHRLENRMDELLGWTGLGHSDGGSSGSGTMEVYCLVVDFDIAKRVVEQDLRGTEFENYARIFDPGKK